MQNLKEGQTLNDSTRNLIIICTQLRHLLVLCLISVCSVWTRTLGFSNADSMKGHVPFLPPPKPRLSVWTQADCVFVIGAIAAPFCEVSYAVLMLVGRKQQTLLPNVFLKTAKFHIAQQHNISKCSVSP